MNCTTCNNTREICSVASGPQVCAFADCRMPCTVCCNSKGGLGAQYRATLRRRLKYLRETRGNLYEKKEAYALEWALSQLELIKGPTNEVLM